MFKKAKRQQSKLRLALIGPSGSGKTYSSLLIAKGLGGSIALIDTERGSGNLYSDIADYDICELAPPFSPENYIQAIQEAEKAGYETIIIDSLSHAWSGQGGVLEFVDQVTKAEKNNFEAWRQASPKHNALVDALVQSRAHIIGTMRSKVAWDVQKDERTGKTKPVKIGLAPVQREGLEYEFTAVLEISVDGHVASASKDRTSLFDGQYFVPGVETGQTLASWLRGAEQATPSEPAKNQGQSVLQFNSGGTVGEEVAQGSQEAHSSQDQNGESRDQLLADLYNALRELGLSGQLDAFHSYIAGKFGCGVRDLSAAQIQEIMANLRKCREDSNLLERFKSYLANFQQVAA
ncbi:MAG: ATP-binding protein [Desulfohalobiaceae bacterium]|nr:ATP-binding protein [Desulfohalobiaceae bacterium]